MLVQSNDFPSSTEQIIPLSTWPSTLDRGAIWVFSEPSFCKLYATYLYTADAALLCCHALVLSTKSCVTGFLVFVRSPLLSLPRSSPRGIPSMASLPYRLNVDAATLSPLPPYLHRGLIAISSFAFLSFVCSTALFVYLTCRFINWALDRRNRRSVYQTNQFLVLIYNLLLADIQQSLAFLLNISAVVHNAINIDMPTCWAQGWFVSTGRSEIRPLLEITIANFWCEKVIWLVVFLSSVSRSTPTSL